MSIQPSIVAALMNGRVAPHEALAAAEIIEPLTAKNRESHSVAGCFMYALGVDYQGKFVPPEGAPAPVVPPDPLAELRTKDVRDLVAQAHKSGTWHPYQKAAALLLDNRALWPEMPASWSAHLSRHDCAEVAAALLLEAMGVPISPAA